MPEPTAPVLPETHNGVRRGGRPSLITRELIEEAENLLRAGNYIETVADFLVIDRGTFRNWLKRGKAQYRRVQAGDEVEEGEALYYDWFCAVRRAQAAAEMSDLANIGAVARGRPRTVRRTTMPDGTQVEEITEGMAPRWEASAWRLERRNRLRYGKGETVKLQHSGDPDGAPMKVEHAGRVQFYIPANGRGLEAADASVPLSESNEEPEGEG